MHENTHEPIATTTRGYLASMRFWSTCAQADIGEGKLQMAVDSLTRASENQANAIGFASI